MPSFHSLPQFKSSKLFLLLKYDSLKDVKTNILSKDLIRRREEGPVVSNFNGVKFGEVVVEM